MDRKRKHLQHEDIVGIDRIGELPDSLLIHILSLLDDMKYAVKTAVLSKRWKYLWTNLDTLVYNCDIENPSIENRKRFMFFVNNTLLQCTCPRINKLCLSGSRFDDMSSSDLFLVDKWLDFVLKKKVEVVKLGLKGLDYRIPVSFFRNSSFVTLEIDDVGKQYYYSHNHRTFSSLVVLVSTFWSHEYRKTVGVSWNMLKSLSLKDVYANKDFMSEILLGCPILETLVLDAVRGLWELDITSPSVRELKVLNFAYTLIADHMDLYITAPWVEKLEVSGCLNYVKCRLVSASSVKNASFTLNYSTFQDVLALDLFEDPDCNNDYSYVSRDMIKDLLQPVCNAEELVVGEEILQALSMSKLLDGNYPIYNCKYVMIKSPICMHEVPGIVRLLESSPYLETLVIKMMPWQCHFSTYNKPGDVIYTKYMDKVFSSFNGIDYLKDRKEKYQCLKNVKIDCTEKLRSCDDEHQSSNNMCFELKIVAHIIKNAPILEKFVISSSRSDCPDFARRYIELLSSESEVGDKASGWDLEERKCTYKFNFC